MPIIDYPDYYIIIKQAMQEFLQKYKIFEKIRQDSLGVVYRAEDLKTHQPVSIKCLESALLNVRALKWRYSSILIALKQLRHPNMVPLIDFFEDTEHYFIIQELWRGDPLSKWLFEMGRMSAKMTIPVLMHILNAFEAAHKRGFIYGHLTADSIVLTSYNAAKIQDFGLSYFLDKNGLLLAENLDAMNLYAAPEQLMRPGKSDQLTDIYRLGMLSYQMLTGNLPLSHIPDRYSVRKAITTGHVPSLLNFPPNVPDVLKHLIFKAIQPHPKKRFQNLTEMKKTLSTVQSPKRYFVPEPVIEKAVIAKPRSRSMKKSMKFAMVGLNACLVALIIFLWAIKSPRNKALDSENVKLPEKATPLIENKLPINIPSAGPVLEKRPTSSAGSIRSRTTKPVIAVQRGSIRITSIPSDARVEILQNGKPIRMRRTPTFFSNLPAGRLSVRIIHAAGYKVYERDLNLQKGARLTIEALLKPLPIPLTINSDPRGAYVFLDGKRINGTTPLTIQINRGGEHRFRFVKHGFKSVEEKHTISPNQRSYRVFAKLPGAPIDFTIRLLVPGRIYLNGVSQNYKWTEKLKLTNINPGKYSLMVLYKNKQVQIKELNVTPAFAGKMIDIYP